MLTTPRALLFLALGAALAGCTAPPPPRLHTPGAIALPAVVVREPRAPELRWPEPERAGEALETPLQAESSSAEELPDLRDRPIGVVGFGGSVDLGPAVEGVGGALLSLFGGGSPSLSGLRSLFDAPARSRAEAMVLRLFRRGARHLVDVQHISDIAVTIEREPPPGEEGERETIRWTGKLDRMLWLGELTRTDYLIVGVVDVAPRTQEARLYKEISAEEGQRYEQEVAAYRATLEAMGTKLLADHSDYDRRVNAAINEYDRALNSYRQRAPSRYKLDQAALEGPREALRARRVAIATEVEQRLGDIEARLGALRPLSAWAADARSEEKLVTVHYADLAVRVRLLETRTGRIVWVHEARLRSRDPARGVAVLLDDVAERLIPSG